MTGEIQTWIAPLTVLASIAAVLVVRAVAVILIHPDATFLPLTLTPVILDTAVLVTIAAFVFRRIVSGGSLPGPILALIGGRFFTLDRVSAFRVVAIRALMISFLPDIGVVVSRPQYWQYALTLAAMHVVAWAVCVWMLTGLVKRAA